MCPSIDQDQGSTNFATTFAVTFEGWFHSKHAAIPLAGTRAVLQLASEGATVPFMARYRKEKTGNLDEVAIQVVLDEKENWDQILKRQAHIISEIERQNKLTPELKTNILSTFQLEILDDIYLPYKQKRKSKATQAKEAGIEPLADWLWNCGHGTETPQPGQTLDIWAFTFRNEEKGYPDAATAIEGAQDILIERLAEMQELRQLVRTTYFEKGHLKTVRSAQTKDTSKFSTYFNYGEAIASLLQPRNSHRYMAIRRGWMEDELVLSIGGPLQSEASEQNKTDDSNVFLDPLIAIMEATACTVHDSVGAAILKKAARMALKAHIIPSIENEVHKALKEIADEASIKVFSDNLRKLLMSAPFGSKAVLGVDPGIRTGCKLAVVNDSGRYIASTVIHLKTEENKQQAAGLICEIVKTGNLQAIAVGNGTAGRETELFIRSTLKTANLTVPVVMVNEAGASVYSASEIAREEFPDLDITVRGAISIARRLQDPLAELVKIDPKSIGVGQYQHDISPHSLKRSLEIVVDSCVNSVGVNLNTASEPLLSHVSGIGPSLAKSIVSHRNTKGVFKSRTQLREVPHFGTKAFEQAAGFLRIPNGETILDNTAIHPESYPVIESLAKKLNKDVKDLIGSGVRLVKQEEASLKGAIGEFTYKDIIQELEKPGRDPRDEFTPFQFREDIHELADLKPGMICPGIVTNVTNFGAFVDIGVHQDGLVHISHLSNRFIKESNQAVEPGDRVQVKVLEVNLEKKQISLSMKDLKTENQGEQKQRHRHDRHPSHPPAHQKDEARRDARPQAKQRQPQQQNQQQQDHQQQKGQQKHEDKQEPRFISDSDKKAAQTIKPREKQASSHPSSSFGRQTKSQFKNNPFAALAGLKATLKSK